MFVKVAVVVAVVFVVVVVVFLARGFLSPANTDLAPRYSRSQASSFEGFGGWVPEINERKW